ncbi:hypothetical protein DV735_g420, partial [Chaetothyriales sp. CBS 134920]
MASKGGANFVRYFFYRGFEMDAETKQRAVALAYATAREQKLAPSKILIRASLHDTTSIGGGKHARDPNGWHLTLAFKDKEHEAIGYHVASHGYTAGKNNFTLVRATHGNEKPDDTPRGGRDSGAVVWPKEEDLVEYKDSPIAYSHLPVPSSEA